MKSFKVELVADSTGEFISNALRFATRAEAEEYASDITWRWTAVRDSRVVESDDPVNYVFKDGRTTRIEKADEEEKRPSLTKLVEDYQAKKRKYGNIPPGATLLIALVAVTLLGCDVQRPPERSVWKLETYTEAQEEGFGNPFTWVDLLNEQGGWSDSNGNWHSLDAKGNVPTGDAITADSKIWYPPTKGLKRVAIKKGRGGHGGDWGGLTLGEWIKETEEAQ